MKPSRYPSALDVELTSVCSLKCPMCPRSQRGFKTHRKHRIGHMSDDVFGRLHGELKGRHGQVRWIWAHVGGEPFRDPQAVERINLLQETGAYIAVASNVVPFVDNHALVHKVLESKLGRLMLSIDGVTKKTYESIRVGADFDKVMEAVDDILRVAKTMEARNQPHPDLWLQCLKMDDTEGEVEAFVRKYSGQGPTTKYHSLKGIKKGRVMLKAHETFGGQVKSRGFGFDGVGGSKGHPRRFKCKKVFGRLTVLSDGSVSICCYDIQGKCVVGYLTENSLNGIWNGAPLQRLRDGFIRAQGQKKRGEKVDNNLFPSFCRRC